MTTTGGRGDVDLNAPVFEQADGDDIVVIPDPPHARPRGRMRAFLVAAIVAVLVAAGITVALTGRHHTGASGLRSVSRVHPPPARPTHKRSVATSPAKTHSRAPVVRVATTVPSVGVVPPVGPPPVTPTLPTAPPTTPAYPASVLTWHATPSALTIKAGSHATLTVTVSNPTDGTVTLGLPLSCPPALQPEPGAPIGGIVCAQMAQVMSPHQTLTQQYTIYATDTGDATGNPLAPGRYVARVENLYSVRVTITAS